MNKMQLKYILIAVFIVGGLFAALNLDNFGWMLGDNRVSSDQTLKRAQDSVIAAKPLKFNKTFAWGSIFEIEQRENGTAAPGLIIKAKNGDYLVNDPANARIVLLDKNGDFKAKYIGVREHWNPISMLALENGCYYVNCYDRVFLMDASLKVIKEFSCESYLVYPTVDTLGNQYAYQEQRAYKERRQRREIVKIDTSGVETVFIQFPFEKIETQFRDVCYNDDKKCLVVIEYDCDEKDTTKFRYYDMDANEIQSRIIAESVPGYVIGCYNDKFLFFEPRYAELYLVDGEKVQTFDLNKLIFEKRGMNVLDSLAIADGPEYDIKLLENGNLLVLFPGIKEMVIFEDDPFNWAK